ncbi:hypothetical protein M0R45_019350 [Rubus argutus]|uniref:Uncharacterized protein n=1 Tax=Rubus argutus TaxID=59490 RepID=A0AAW1X8U0_RUBAR
MAKLSHQNQKTNANNNNATPFIEASPGTDGPADMRLICGTRIAGMNHKTRKAAKEHMMMKKLPLMLDLAALKYWGQDTILNFPLVTYQKEMNEMESQSREEYWILKKEEQWFFSWSFQYRGVARHHHNGRWEARIGRAFWKQVSLSRDICYPRRGGNSI